MHRWLPRLIAVAMWPDLSRGLVLVMTQHFLFAWSLVMRPLPMSPSPYFAGFQGQFCPMVSTFIKPLLL